MSLSFVYPPSHKSSVGMCLGHAESLLHYSVPQEGQAGLMCSWKSSSWMSGRKQRRGVRNTEPRVSAACGTVGSTAEHTHPSVCTEPTGSVTRDSAPRNTTQLLQPSASLTKATLHVLCLSGREHSTSFFASVLSYFWLGQLKLSKISRISTQTLLEKDLHFAGIHSLQN